MANKEKMKLLSKRSSYQIPRILCACLRSYKEKRLIKKGMDKIERELEIDRFLKA